MHAFSNYWRRSVYLIFLIFGVRLMSGRFWIMRNWSLTWCPPNWPFNISLVESSIQSSIALLDSWLFENSLCYIVWQKLLFYVYWDYFKPVWWEFKDDFSRPKVHKHGEKVHLLLMVCVFVHVAWFFHLANAQSIWCQVLI